MTHAVARSLGDLSRRERWYCFGGIAALLTLGGAGFLPLFGQPGYEFALAAGLVLPSILAISAAISAVESSASPVEVLLKALSAAVLIGVLGAGVALAHGFRTTPCDPWRGLAIYALGGGGGALTGAHWGFWMGLLVGRARVRRKRLWGTLAALAGPGAGIAASLWRFFSSPMVFAFDPFFGYFAGPLYDTVVNPLDELVSYRIGSVFTLLTGVLLSTALARQASGRLRLTLHPRVVTLLVPSLLISIGVAWSGSALGHFSTTASIRGELAASARSGRCVVWHRPHQPARDMALLAKDCSATLGRLEAWFGLPPDDQDVRVFLYSSPGDKARLMGASRTYVAKPWRREIYLNAHGFPHPVLPHELAHIVAGRFGRGPLRIAGSLGGLVPDPGRIEGFAEAAAPDTDSALSLEESAQAMLALEILPPLANLFALNFLGYNASTGYAAAGAFVTWLRGEVGSSALRAWYSGASLEDATGASLQELERRWHASLASNKLSAAKLAQARDIFERPAIFGRRCPRLVDELQGEAARALAEGAVSEASARFERLLQYDPRSLAAELGLAACAVRCDRPADAQRLYESLLAQKRLTTLERAAVQEASGDLWLIRGSLDRARESYRAAFEAHADEGELRSLQVKADADAPEARRAVIALLLGDRTGQGWSEAVEALFRWSEVAPGSALPEYLLGKNWYAFGKYELASLHLDAALERGGLSTLILREATKVRMLSACILGDRARFQAIAKQLLATAEPGGDEANRRELIARCAGVIGG